MRNQIIIVCGPSGVGKTWLANMAKQELDEGIWVEDIDDPGVPSGGVEHWRLWRVEQMLADAIKREGPSLIFGVIRPHEVLAAPEYDPFRVSFVVLLAEMSLIEKRLRERCYSEDKRWERMPEAKFIEIVEYNRRLSDLLLRQSRGLLRSQHVYVDAVSHEFVWNLMTWELPVDTDQPVVYTYGTDG